MPKKIEIIRIKDQGKFFQISFRENGYPMRSTFFKKKLDDLCDGLRIVHNSFMSDKEKEEGLYYSKYQKINGVWRKGDE